MRLFLAMAVVLMAGCMDASPTAPDGGVEAQGPDGWENVTWPFVAEASGDHPAVVGACTQDGPILAGVSQLPQDVKIPEGTNTSILELKWDGPVTSFCVELRGSGSVARFHCMEDCLLASKQQWELVSPEAGRYSIQLGVHGTAAQLEFEFALSSFKDAPPADYSAW